MSEKSSIFAVKLKNKHLLTIKTKTIMKASSNKLQPSISLDEVRNLYNSGYAGRAKLREMGVGVTLDGMAWNRNGAYIGKV